VEEEAKSAVPGPAASGDHWQAEAGSLAGIAAGPDADLEGSTAFLCCAAVTPKGFG
jgi:hypothetical protein